MSDKKLSHTQSAVSTVTIVLFIVCLTLHSQDCIQGIICPLWPSLSVAEVMIWANNIQLPNIVLWPIYTPAQQCIVTYLHTYPAVCCNLYIHLPSSVLWPIYTYPAACCDLYIHLPSSVLWPIYTPTQQRVVTYIHLPNSVWWTLYTPTQVCVVTYINPLKSMLWPI